MNELELDLQCQGDKGFRLALQCTLPGSGITAVYGPSGSGKSTLLDCIAGLRQTEARSVIRLGETCWQSPAAAQPPWRRQIGYVFQDARLFPHLNVEQNLNYALQRRVTTDIDLQDIVSWLDLAELLPRNPANLSAGQKQRVAIGRALLSAPQLLLLDEPLANLDHSARQKCIHGLTRASRELDIPMIYVSHDIEEVSQLADYLVLLEQGSLVDQGTLLNLCSRLDTRLSREEQAAAILTAQIKQHDEEYQLTQLDIEGCSLFVNHLPQSPGQQCRVRIPARDVSLCRTRPTDSSILNILPVTLCEMQNSQGARLMLRLQLGTQFLLARITRRSAAELQLKIGDALYAQIKSAALLMEAANSP